MIFDLIIKMGAITTHRYIAVTSWPVFLRCDLSHKNKGGGGSNLFLTSSVATPRGSKKEQ